MKLYFLDASAWVKRYFHEAGSDYVISLFERNNLLSACTLGLIEVTATAARKRSAGDIDQGRFQQSKRRLLEDWGRLLWVELTPEVRETALQVAETYALRGADSVHLASALLLHAQLGISNHDFTFVSSDQELNVAARAARLSVIDPENGI
jgi:predicted nucleic acid-binding protein